MRSKGPTKTVPGGHGVTREVTRYTSPTMILGFRHGGLERLYEKGDRRRIPADLVPKVERVLARLDVAAKPEEMNLPGFRLHPLKGDRAGCWAARVSADWRVVFRFDGRDVRNVDLTDYH